MASASTFPLVRLHGWGIRHPWWYYTVPLAAWAGLIAVASLAPPENLPQFDFVLADKVEHGLCYTILGILLLRGWSRERRPTAAGCLTILSVACAWGIYLEFLQRLTGYRTFDWWDAFTNGVGALIGVILWIWAARRLALNTGPEIPADYQTSSTQESEG